MNNKMTSKNLLSIIGNQLKISIKNIFEIKRKRNVKQKYSIFVNFNKHFQRHVTPISRNIFFKYLNFFKETYRTRILRFKKFNQQINKKFLYRFFIKKQHFIKQLFVRTFYMFIQRLEQSFYMINAFPQFLLNFVKPSIKKEHIQDYIDMFASHSMEFFNFENLTKIKLEFAKNLQQLLLKSKNLSYVKRFFSNKIFFALLNQIINSIVVKEKFERHIIYHFNHWVARYRLFLKEKAYKALNAQKKKKQEYAENYRLLKEKFNNNLTEFLEYQKAQARIKLIEYKKYNIRSSVLLYRLKYLYLYTKKDILRNISLIPIKNYYKKYIENYPLKITFTYAKFNFIKKLATIKTIPPENLLEHQHIILKLAFISKRLFKYFITNINKIKNKKTLTIETKLNNLNAFVFKIYTRFKKFSFNKIKKNLIFTKKLPITSNYITLPQQIANINILKNKNLLVKARFNSYMEKNTLFSKMNLIQNLETTNLLKNTSDILRAEHFRNLLNKEQAFFEIFYKQQSTLQLLTTITGHNIYLTLFNTKPYHILWKASAGMLGLKNFRRAKKHQMTFKDLLIRCQMFLARNRIFFQKPLHLKLRYLNYFGTKNFLSFFISQQKPNYNFDTYKNYKIYNFYHNAKHLCNNYALQFMSMVWSRAKKSYPKVYQATLSNLMQHHKRQNKAFPYLFEQSHNNIGLQTDPRLENFFKKNPFVIK